MTEADYSLQLTSRFGFDVNDPLAHCADAREERLLTQSSVFGIDMTLVDESLRMLGATTRKYPSAPVALE